MEKSIAFFLKASLNHYTGCPRNKLKSLKVAQLKDEMDGDEDDGCDNVCDVVVVW